MLVVCRAIAAAAALVSQGCKKRVNQSLGRRQRALRSFVAGATALKTPLQAATHSPRIFGPPVRGRWPLPEGGKLRRSLPAPYLRPPPKKCGAGAHAAPLAPLFWADLHAIASGAPRRGAVIALFGEAVRDHTDGPLCERWAAEAQLSPVCACRREMPTSSRRAHSLPERLRAEPGRGEGSTGHYSPV